MKEREKFALPVLAKDDMIKFLEAPETDIITYLERTEKFAKYLETTEKFALPTLTEADIIKAVRAKHNGVFGRKVTWISDEVASYDPVLKKPIIYTVTKTMNVRLGIHHSRMKSVIARKAAEDAAIGATKTRRESSYTRLKDEKGVLVEPEFFMRDKKTMLKKYLQVFINTPRTLNVVKKYYKNGVDVSNHDEICKTIDSLIKPHSKSSGGPIETWALPLEKITKII